MALDSSQVYEPKVGFQYSAVIRARPDDIFLRDVPPLPSHSEGIRRAPGGVFGSGNEDLQWWFQIALSTST